MIRADQIPPEVKRAMRVAWAQRNNGDAPEKMMADLAVAAINAWPGGHSFTMVPRIVLPLTTQESSDE